MQIKLTAAMTQCINANAVTAISNSLVTGTGAESIAAFDVDAELSKPTLTQKGDLWLLGRHRLICGDAILPEVFDTLLDGKKVNLVVTDPPYNVNYSSDAGPIQNDNMADNDFYNFLLASYKNMANAMADDASIYVFHADTEGLNFRKAFVDAGFYLSGVCIWAKQSLVLGRSPYQWKHEPILFGWKKNGKHKWFADRKQSTVWNFDRPKKSELHPPMKPIALVAYRRIEADIKAIASEFIIKEIAYDRYNATQIILNLMDEGLTMVPFGQGFKDMSPPTKEIFTLVLKNKIVHNMNPVLRWNFDNVCVETDAAENIKPSKKHSTERIDGAVSTIMALDRAVRNMNVNTSSVYDERGVLVI